MKVPTWVLRRDLSSYAFEKYGSDAKLYNSIHDLETLLIGTKRKPITKKRAKARRGPMRDPKYRRWLNGRACVVGTPFQFPECSAAYQFGRIGSEAAHTQNNGMRSKGPDSSCVPLCRKHHDEYDFGREAFEKKYCVDMKALAAEHYARYCAQTGAK